MTRIALTTAFTLAFAAPALASDQLAAKLGVEPGVYTTAELVAIDRAFQDDETARANAILANPGGFGGTDIETVRAINLNAAEQDEEQASANFIRKQGDFDGVTVSTKSGISAGHAQLATSLGVDAADYSLAELVQLKSVQSSDNGRDG